MGKNWVKRSEIQPGVNHSFYGVEGNLLWRVHEMCPGTTQFTRFINSLGRGTILNLLILVRMVEMKAGCEKLQRTLLIQLDCALRWQMGFRAEWCTFQVSHIRRWTLSCLWPQRNKSWYCNSLMEMPVQCSRMVWKVNGLLETTGKEAGKQNKAPVGLHKSATCCVRNCMCRFFLPLPYLRKDKAEWNRLNEEH